MTIYLGIAAGALLGLLYYRFIGCKSGQCAITSSRLGSMAYGALLGGVLISNFSFGQGNGIQNVDNTRFASKMKEKNVVILDVRTPEEFQSGYIKGAILINVQSAGFDAAIQKLDKQKTYLVYCRSGARSMNAARKMKSAGFEQLYNLDGGIMGWNGPVVR